MLKLLRRRALGTALFAVLCVVVTAPPVFADLLGTDWGFSGSSNLYRINTNTGTATIIGPTGVSRLIGLVVDTDNTIYAVSEEANSRLWTLDPTTGAATLVGSLGFNLQEGDMTINPLTGDMYVSDGAGDDLYIVDKTTASASLVGPYGAIGRDVSGLQFFGSTLYGLALRDSADDVLVTVDPSTGAATLVGTTGTDLGVIAAMGRDPANGTTFIAGPLTDFGSDNVLYSIDLTTGAATLVGPLVGVTASISGFSVAGEPTILTPEPGSLLLLGAGLALLGIPAYRRRKLS